MNSNLQIINSAGCKELLLRKLSYAVTSSVLSQVIILFVFLFIVTFNIFDPMGWLKVAIETLTSLSTLLFIVPFLSIIFAQSIICAKNYVLKPTYYSTRIQKMFAVLSVRNLVLLILHVLIGGLVVWLFLTIVGGKYGKLYVQCKTNKMCMVEESFYLTLSGLWIGFYFFLFMYTSEKKMIFPVIQQHKLLQFKSKLMPLLNECKQAAIWPCFCYFILYFIWGMKIKTFYLAFFDLHASDEPLNILIYVYTWLFAALYIFNMSLMHYFFELFLTEPIQFAILKSTKNDLILTEALDINNIPLVQHLACLDLFLLSHNSVQRREVLFTLSQPGNHPHNWNNLIEVCLKIITQYTQMLNISTNTIATLEQGKNPKLIANTLTQSPMSKTYYGNIRNLSLRNVDCPLDFVEISQKKKVPFSELTEPVRGELIKNFKSFIAKIKTRLGITFLFEELPVASIQSCISNGQIIIWITQALSNLVAASLKEDHFGIVQNNLPVVLSSLLELKQSAEKLNKITALTFKGHNTDDFNTKMKLALNSAIRRSLYNICINFGSYLKDLTLDKDILLVLQSYVVNQNVKV